MYSRRPYSSVPYSAVEQPATAAPAAVTPVFSEYARPVTAGLTAAVIATTIIGFVAPPPAQAAVQPTPVFSAFEQPARPKSAAHQQPSVVFNIAPSITAAFTGFSDFGAPQSARAPQHEQSVRFEIGFLGPAKTPDRLIFSDFGQPSKPRAAQDGFANAPQPPAVQNYVFGKYDQPQPKKPPLFDASVQFTIQPPVIAAVSQAYVFSAFSQPPPVVRVSVHQQPQPAFEVAQVILAVTPSPLVFTQFSQPSFSRTYKVEQHPEVRFRILRPDAATPGPGIFPPFDQPAFSRTFPAHQQPSVTYALATQQPAAPIVTGGDFADFELPPKVINRAALEGFTNAPQPQPVQAYVFAPFSQPVRTPSVKEGQVSFEIGFLGPASTPDRLTFAEFAQPKFARGARDGFSNAPVAPVVQNYVFSLFEQPQFKRAVQFDQQFANPPAVPAVQPYVFGRFEQPLVRKVIQSEPSVQFAPQPTVVVAAVSFTGFSDFAIPQKAPQQNGASVQFEILPPVFVPSVYTFTGFSDFAAPQQRKVIPQDGSAIQFVIVQPPASPVPPVISDGGGGKRHGIHSGKSRSWKPLKKKPVELIDELEELIAELDKLARLSPKQVVKAPAPVILARYPQPLADALFDLEQKQSAKAIKASISRAQAEAEYQLALQQEEDDDDAAFLLLM